jgi:hypothetical protein
MFSRDVLYTMQRFLQLYFDEAQCCNNIATERLSVYYLHEWYLR